MFNISPGMSHFWHGAQANNKHSVTIAPSILYPLSFGLHFDTNAAQSSASNSIKEIGVKEYGDYDGISLYIFRTRIESRGKFSMALSTIGSPHMWLL